MEFRLGTMNDLQNICSLVAAAIETMEEQGIHQWDKVYPTREDFANDIANGTLYTVTEESRLIAIYTISTEYDPEYLNAEWECHKTRYRLQFSSNAFLHLRNPDRLGIPRNMPFLICSSLSVWRKEKAQLS